MSGEWHRMSALALGAGIESGAIDPRALTEYFLDRIEAADGERTIYLRLTPGRAPRRGRGRPPARASRAQAVAARRRADLVEGPLRQRRRRHQPWHAGAGRNGSLGGTRRDGAGPCDPRRPGLPRQDQPDRVRLLHPGSQPHDGHAAQPLRRGRPAHSGRLVLGRRGFPLARPRCRRHRLGHRRLRPRAGGLERPRRAEDELRPAAVGRRARAQHQHGYGGPAHPRRGRCGGDLRRARRALSVRATARHRTSQAPISRVPASHYRRRWCGRRWIPASTLRHGARSSGSALPGAPSRRRRCPSSMRSRNLVGRFGAYHAAECHALWHDVIEANPDLIYTPIYERIRVGAEMSATDAARAKQGFDAVAPALHDRIRRHGVFLMPTAAQSPPPIAALEADSEVYRTANIGGAPQHAHRQLPQLLRADAALRARRERRAGRPHADGAPRR